MKNCGADHAPQFLSLQFFPVGTKLQASIGAGNEGTSPFINVIIFNIRLVGLSAGIVIIFHATDTVRGMVIDMVHLLTVLLAGLIHNVRCLREGACGCADITGGTGII